MKEAQIRIAALSQIYIHGVVPCRRLYAETLNKSVHIFIKKWPWPCLLSSMAISAVSYGGYSSTEHISTKENMNRGTLWSISRFRCESNYLEKYRSIGAMWKKRREAAASHHQQRCCWAAGCEAEGTFSSTSVSTALFITAKIRCQSDIHQWLSTQRKCGISIQ